MKLSDPQSIHALGIDPTDLPSTTFHNRAALPKKPGIYFILNAYNSILYIGRSYCLKKRWNENHHLLPLLLTLDNIRIAYIDFECDHPMSARNTLLGLEYLFICQFKPLYNRTKYESIVR